MLLAENILQANVVLIQQGFHAGSILRGQTNAQRRKDVGDNLAKDQVDGQGRMYSFRGRKYFFADFQSPRHPIVGEKLVGVG